MMRRTTTVFLVLASLLGGLSLSEVVLAGEETVVTTQEANSVASVRDVKVDGSSVSGTLVNNSHRALRDVKLLIRHAWLWKDEHHPGDDNPGRTDTYAFPKEIPAGGSEKFTYTTTPPLPVRTDGRFLTSVQVIGFTEVGF